jgi:hypothetical protein
MTELPYIVSQTHFFCLWFLSLSILFKLPKAPPLEGILSNSMLWMAMLTYFVGVYLL